MNYPPPDHYQRMLASVGRYQAALWVVDDILHAGVPADAAPTMLTLGVKAAAEVLAAAAISAKIAAEDAEVGSSPRHDLEVTLGRLHQAIKAIEALLPVVSSAAWPKGDHYAE